MAVENKLVRRNEGTIASPAGLQNKQFKFDVGDDGAGGDETRMIYKDSATKTHEFWTVEEAKRWIANYTSSSSGGLTGSPFIIVSSIEEYIEACELPLVENIWCDDGNGYGIAIESESDNDVHVIDLTTTKNIYGAGGVGLNVIVDNSTYTTPVISLTYRFPNDGNCHANHFDKIQVSSAVSGENDGYFDLLADNNFTGTPTGDKGVRLSTIECKDATIIQFINFIVSDYPEGFNIERNMTSIVETNVVNVLWSGKNDRVWVDENTCITEAESNTIMKVDGFWGTATVEESGGYETTGEPQSRRAYKTDDVDYCTDDHYIAKSAEPSSYTKKMRELDSALLVEVETVNSNGQSSIGQSGLSHWADDVNVRQVRGASLYSYIKEGILYSGIAYSCYYSAGWWRFNEERPARFEEYSNGSFKIYKSSTAPIIGNNILPVETLPYISTKNASNILTTGVISALTTDVPRVGYYNISLNAKFLSDDANYSYTAQIKQGAVVLGYIGSGANPASATVFTDGTDNTSFIVHLTDIVNDITVDVTQTTNTELVTINLSINSMSEGHDI